jgi:tellurite resistance protein
MTPETAEIMIKDLVKGMRKRLEQAAHMAKAAHACAASGSPEKGIEIVLDLGQDLREAENLLGAALAVNRISKS